MERTTTCYEDFIRHMEESKFKYVPGKPHLYHTRSICTDSRDRAFIQLLYVDGILAAIGFQSLREYSQTSVAGCAIVHDRNGLLDSSSRAGDIFHVTNSRDSFWEFETLDATTGIPTTYVPTIAFPGFFEASGDAVRILIRTVTQKGKSYLSDSRLISDDWFNQIARTDNESLLQDVISTDRPRLMCAVVQNPIFDLASHFDNLPLIPSLFAIAHPRAKEILADRFYDGKLPDALSTIYAELYTPKTVPEIERLVVLATQDKTRAVNQQLFQWIIQQRVPEMVRESEDLSQLQFSEKAMSIMVHGLLVHTQRKTFAAFAHLPYRYGAVARKFIHRVRAVKDTQLNAIINPILQENPIFPKIELVIEHI